MTRSVWTLAMAATLAACGGAESPTQPDAPLASSGPELVVTSASWEAPQPIADAGELPFGRCSQFTETLCRIFSERTAPVVAASAGGQAVALWQRWEGDAYRLVAGRFAPGGGWSDAERVTTETSVLSQRVVADGRGNSIALWFANGQVATSYGAVAGGWSPPQGIERAADPQLAMDEGGTGYLLFTRNRDGLYWSRLEPSTAWSAPARIQAEGPGSQPFLDDPRLAITRGGGLLAVWLRHFQSTVRDEEWDEVWSSRMRPGQPWTAPSAFARFPRAYALSPTLAASDTGGVVSYQLVERVAGGFDQRRVLEQHETGAGGNAESSWTAPAAVSAPPPAPPAVRNAERPAIARDARGTLTLAWAETSYAPSEPHRYEIRARRFSASTGAWDATQVVADAPGFLHDRVGLHVAASAAGNAVVLWTQQEAFRSRLWASVFVPGAGWSAPRELRAAERLSAPDLAMDGSGNAFVVWSEPEGDRARIWSARLAAVTVTSFLPP